MRISKIKVPLIKTKLVHLKEIDLTTKQLGSTIALVGRNGAGKSRVLKFVETYITQLTEEQFIDKHIQDIPENIIQPVAANIKVYQQHMELLKGSGLNSQQVKQQTNAKTEHINVVLKRIRDFGQAYIKIVDNDDLKNIKSNIGNASALTFEQILANQHYDILFSNSVSPQAKTNLNEFTAFNNQSTINYLNKLTTDIIRDEFQLFMENKTDLEKINSELKERESFKLFQKFQEYVKQFLGKDFSYKQSSEGTTFNSILHFNNEPFDLNLFSPGQKTLFAYAILFFYMDTNSKTNIKQSIIIIDEPEKHLHPEAQIALIKAIKSIIAEEGQLWIATHSIHILAHLEYDEIMMVKDDGIVEPSRTTPGKSFNDLMGIDDHISELITFVTSISEWAYGNFMTQCFKDPEVVFGNNPQDPQFKLFKDFLSEKTNVGLLDYGAGKGRIGYTINEDSVTMAKVNYSAFSYDKANYELLSKVPNIKVVYSTSTEIPDNSFDCVLLCNVLHEINPKEWVDVLLNIKRVLKDDGYLLIIEDKYLPKGESAHEFGYLILGTAETKKLLKTEDVLELQLNERELKDRILFNAYRKEQIHPSNESVINAVKLLKENSFSNIKALRKKKEEDVSRGRQYANQTQLYINSQLALETLKK